MVRREWGPGLCSRESETWVSFSQAFSLFALSSCGASSQKVVGGQQDLATRQAQVCVLALALTI